MVAENLLRATYDVLKAHSLRNRLLRYQDSSINPLCPTVFDQTEDGWRC